MKELQSNTKRLARALYNTDDSYIESLAHILRYVPSQLKKDIEALKEFTEKELTE